MEIVRIFIQEPASGAAMYKMDLRLRNGHVESVVISKEQYEQLATVYAEHIHMKAEDFYDWNSAMYAKHFLCEEVHEPQDEVAELIGESAALKKKGKE